MLLLALLLHLLFSLLEASTCPFKHQIACLKWDNEIRITVVKTKLECRLDLLTKEIVTLKEASKKKNDVSLQKKNIEIENKIKARVQFDQEIMSKVKNVLQTKVVEIEKKMQSKFEKDLQNKVVEIEKKMQSKFEKDLQTKVIEIEKKMQTKFEKDLQTKVVEIEKKMNENNRKIETEIKKKDGEIEKGLNFTNNKLDLHMSHKWKIKLFYLNLPKMTGLKLSGQTPIIRQSLSYMPKRTSALIIQLYIYQWRGNKLKGHLAGSIGQADDFDTDVAFHAAYDQGWIQQILIPWNDRWSNVLELRVSNSYNSDPSALWFTFRVTGYIIA